MFVGHFAVGFAAKRAAPKVSLGTLILAACLSDVLWICFFPARIEQVVIQPGLMVANSLNLVYIYVRRNSVPVRGDGNSSPRSCATCGLDGLYRAPEASWQGQVFNQAETVAERQVIAADSSSFIAHLSGRKGEDVEILDQALSDHLVVMPPVVLVELLSDPMLSPSVSDLLKALPLLETTDSFWHRAGALLAKAYPEAEKLEWQIR
jgi:hypothetical protein